MDSTSLPNDIDNNPFNALSCHGIDSSSIQTRLVLVLDEETGFPVWYDIIPGNVLDISDIMNTIIFLNMRKALDDSGLSVSEVTGKTQSLMCFRNKHGEILIETLNKKVKVYYKLIGETIPASLKIKDFRRKVMLS